MRTDGVDGRRRGRGHRRNASSSISRIDRLSRLGRCAGPALNAVGHGQAVGFEVLVALLDVLDAAAALLGRLGRLVLLVQLEDLDAGADVVDGLLGELADGRDHVREGRVGVEPGGERVHTQGHQSTLYCGICKLVVSSALNRRGEGE